LAERILIVNADDFGLSEGVNRGIAIAHEQGIVTSASLMVKRPAAAQASAYASHHPGLSVGLHVDLGESVYRNGEWTTEVAFEGAIEQEIEEQVDQFRRLMGRNPTHIDSHQHKHLRNERIESFLRALAVGLDVPLRGVGTRVRYCGNFHGQSGKGEPWHELISVDSLLRLLAEIPAGITELGCHPGAGPPFEPVYGQERAIETQTLCDPRVRAAVVENEIKLASFAELAGSVDAARQ
jgi:predicted glycoside hydrolase/deacetylase ChbG (UPF0249 family)